MVRVVFLAFAICSPGCTDAQSEPLPECVQLDIDPSTCSPLFPATFDRIYDEVFAGADGLSGCAAGGGACHANAEASGAQGGMVFDADRDQVYAAISMFIEAGDAACGPLSVRVHTRQSEFVMPPGSQRLDEGARCAIAQWVEAGAQR